MHKHILLSPAVIDHFSTKTADGWEHSFLSNGYIESDGSFVEREYQACKTLDTQWQKRILICTLPFGEGGSKQLGREAPLRPDWNEVKFQFMTSLVFRKFFDHPELAKQLLATKDALLIEGNTWHDNIWGNCHCDRSDCQQTGLNWLGHILMSAREALRQSR